MGQERLAGGLGELTVIECDGEQAANAGHEQVEAVLADRGAAGL